MQLVEALERFNLKSAAVQIINVTTLETSMVVTFHEFGYRPETGDRVRVAIVDYDYNVINSIIAG